MLSIVFGDIFSDQLSEEEKSVREKKRREYEKRLETETDKEFEPITLPIVPPADFSNIGRDDYNAIREEYLKLKEEYTAIKELRSKIKANFNERNIRWRR